MTFGAPQILALVVLLQRCLEDVHARRNTARLLAAGAREAGRGFYPVVVVTHLGWLAAVFLLIPADAPVLWPFLVLYGVLQIARYWVIATLGPLWTMRIVTRDDLPLLRRGPFRLVRHPNYAVVVLEVAVLPMAFGAWWVALGSVAVIGAVLGWKIRLEDAALRGRRAEA